MTRCVLSAFAGVVALALPLTAAPVTYEAFLDGPSESPANASPGTGYATVTIDPVAHTMSVTANFADLLGTTTASHIHVINGPGDSNTLDTLGPVATVVPSFPNFPLGVTSGNFNDSFDTSFGSSFNPSWVTANGGSVPLSESELFAAIADGRAYLNIHTSLFQSGEIRGFFRAVPAPGSAALLGLGLIAAARRRR